MGLIDSLKSGLEKSRRNLAEKLGGLIRGSSALDDDFFEELEATLILSDTGATVASRLIESARKTVRKNNLQNPAEILPVLEQEIAAMMMDDGSGALPVAESPHVILIVGVNGSGKTTSIGKLAFHYIQQGKKVLLAAGDTFRAAAGEQLTLWAERTGAEIVCHGEGADPAAVVYDSLAAAKARKTDLLIIDTAGRLHTKTNLMEELKKIRQVIAKKHPGAPHRTILILDATTGQNALSQTKLFDETAGIDEIILTKLDGTAKGGVAVAVAMQHKLPITFVGLGEKMEDLRPFDGDDFARALLGQERNA